MPVNYSFEALMRVLEQRVPEEAHVIRRERRLVECGLLSVGIKLHFISPGRRLDQLIEKLGGSAVVPGLNIYRHADAACTLILPPVGSARIAIRLIEAIEAYTEHQIFDTQTVQIQVCSPFKLTPERCALLGIGFYLGSNKLRFFETGAFKTTVSYAYARRGERLVLYDAQGDFERGFQWWSRRPYRAKRFSGLLGLATVPHLLKRPRFEAALPIRNGRSDILSARSRIDIHNINLIATLLVHHQTVASDFGYWSALGERFEAEFVQLLKEHQLTGIAMAPWVEFPDQPTESIIEADEHFDAAIQELVSYVFEESDRTQDENEISIMRQMRELLKKYRDTIYETCRTFDGGTA